jgi:hypothetical protein
MPSWKDEFELGDDGRLRKKRVLPDGDRIHFSMTMMDNAAFGFFPRFSDGSPDFTNPHRPGHRFADTDDAARLRAEEAYQERSRRMSDGWKHKGEQRSDDARVTSRAHPQRTLDELRAAAEAAYEARNERLRNAWRDKR